MRVIIVLLTVASLFIGPSLKAQDETDVLTKILSKSVSAGLIWATGRPGIGIVSRWIPGTS